MQLVACQLDISWQDKAANFRHVRALLGQAEIRPGSLIALPEMFATGFSLDVQRIAERADGETQQFLQSLAAELDSTVLAGVVTRSADGKGRNEAIAVSPGGLVGRYSKLHPFSYGGESECYVPGTQLLTFPCAEFAVAPFVCYDLRFPEVFRRAAMRSAQLMVVIANWPQERDEHWQTLLRARAIENQSYVVGVNRTGRDPKLTYIGNSQIIGPRGEITAHAGEKPGTISAELDLDSLAQYRREFPALADMRSECFEL